MAEIHPVPVMSGAGARSRKRHGGFAPLTNYSCRSANDPSLVILLIVFAL